MKKLTIIILVLVLVLGSFTVYVAYRVTNGEFLNSGTSIRISDNEDKFELSARYPSRLTGKVQRYVDARLRTDFFSSRRINEDITLDDDTKIYVSNLRGKLVIKLLKNENSPEAYMRIKKLVADVKDHLTD